MCLFKIGEKDFTVCLKKKNLPLGGGGWVHEGEVQQHTHISPWAPISSIQSRVVPMENICVGIASTFISFSHGTASAANCLEKIPQA